ncbi:transporter substrate-binding domain-containing protein [Halarcobacter anaerophilus]|uniref:transporter substrate-binding domain-containing protein n=1 Tax=Halarcobacter anaerophilus TaxID=877500 RepID=UPI0005C8AC13|nr:transporter substrate-binding domain-containing protein [Halarcobacter anaerophilus]
MIFRFLLLLLILFSNIFADQKNLDKGISNSIASSFYELNEEEVENILKTYMQENSQIKYIAVYDSLTNKRFLFLYKNRDSEILNESFDETALQIDCVPRISEIIYKNELIGRIKVCYKNAAESILLNDEEKKWLKTHPVIKVHNEYDWAPFNFNKNDTPLGYSIDYMKLLARIAGLKIKFETGTWDESLKKAFNKKIDVMLNIAKTKHREKSLLYVGVYARNLTSILAKEEREDISDLHSLFGKKVSVVKGFIYEEYLEENFPKIEVVSYPNTLESIKAVVYGEVDATLGKTAILNNMLSENVIKGLKYTSDVKADDPEMENLYIAVRNDYPLLQSILKKAMKKVSLEDIDKLKLKWFNQKRKINFSKEEYKWLDKKIVVKYSEIDWKPLSIIENNSMSGIMGDYLNIIADETEIEFKYVPSNSWHDVLEKFKKGEIDLIPGIGTSKKETSFGLVSDEYASYPMVMVTNENIDYVQSLDSVKNKVFSIPKYYTSYNYIKGLYPKTKIIETNSIFEALLKVSNKEADIYVGHIAPALYNISKIGKDNLKLAGTTGEDFHHHYLINPKMPELLSIVNKVFKTISQKDKERIYNGWVKVKVEESKGFPLKKILSYVLPTILIILAILSIIVYWNKKLRSLVEKKTADINKQKQELQNSLDSLDRNVIFSHTDLEGKITLVSKAFCKISGYSSAELIGKQHNIVKHPKMEKETFKELWESLKAAKVWEGEIQNKKKDGTSYWLYSKIEPNYNDERQIIGYKSISQDITDKKRVEDLSKNLEKKVEERTIELSEQKKFVQTILDSQEQMIVTTDGENLVSVNKSFKDFFEVDTIEEFKKRYGDCICSTFNTEAPKGFLQIFMNNQKWTDYIIENKKKINKVSIKKDEKEYIFSVTAALMPIGRKLKSAVFTDITNLEVIRKELEQINQNIKDSIKYASIIQDALIPEEDLFKKYFSDFLTIWQPKDIVGGDIYLFEELRDENECILMVVDCTGHGVAGAFVTMLVKAIERQIISNIISSDEVVNPAKLLTVFNKSMKHLLKQEDQTSISNAGFDGAILYYNKKENIIKFAGAEIPLFYEYKGEIKMIKADRHSIGYKKSDIEHVFKEHTIKVEKNMQFYLTTDGYIDQNGGEKGFPFGRRKFINLLKDNFNLPLKKQQEILLNEMKKYQNKYENNDDITIVGLKI